MYLRINEFKNIKRYFIFFFSSDKLNLSESSKGISSTLFNNLFPIDLTLLLKIEDLEVIALLLLLLLLLCTLKDDILLFFLTTLRLEFVFLKTDLLSLVSLFITDRIFSTYSF